MTDALINQDGLDGESIENAKAVLRTVEAAMLEADEASDAMVLHLAQELIEEYEKDSSWHNQSPATKVDATDYQSLVEIAEQTGD